MQNSEVSGDWVSTTQAFISYILHKYYNNSKFLSLETLIKSCYLCFHWTNLKYCVPHLSEAVHFMFSFIRQCSFHYFCIWLSYNASKKSNFILCVLSWLQFWGWEKVPLADRNRPETAYEVIISHRGSFRFLSLFEVWFLWWGIRSQDT